MDYNGRRIRGRNGGTGANNHGDGSSLSSGGRSSDSEAQKALATIAHALLPLLSTIPNVDDSGLKPVLDILAANKTVPQAPTSGQLRHEANMARNRVNKHQESIARLQSDIVGFEQKINDARKALVESNHALEEAKQKSQAADAALEAFYNKPIATQEKSATPSAVSDSVRGDAADGTQSANGSQRKRKGIDDQFPDDWTSESDLEGDQNMPFADDMDAEGVRKLQNDNRKLLSELRKLRRTNAPSTPSPGADEGTITADNQAMASALSAAIATGGAAGNAMASTSASTVMQHSGTSSATPSQQGG